MLLLLLTCNIYNMSGRSGSELQHEPHASDCKADTDRTRMLYLTCEMHTCRTSRFAIIFTIQLIFNEKIKLNVYANQDESVPELQASATVTISIVLASWIIHEFYKCFHIRLVSALNSSTGWRTVVPYHILIVRKYIHRNWKVEICFTVFPYRESNPGHLGENQES